ncbi:hypothetical protein HMPREF3069_04955 [Achromobacter xylosoxidans]|uniref:hypothetical protein n=1 Tax=Alcaligenes xylosoxydans xylosoxydans TaxID=85698 RepID=UPI0008A6548F|nr:hypothetical protein [Achromobacter xylosoxidans]OFS61643.1 hypothetical protein HMPREF3069_04955 [Achromobacter xylosoxidans]
MLFAAFFYVFVALIACLTALGYVSSTAAAVVFVVALVVALLSILKLHDIALKRLQRWEKSRPKQWAHLRSALERLERWDELRRKRQSDSEPEGQITTESSADLAQTKDQPMLDKPQIGR